MSDNMNYPFRPWYANERSPFDFVFTLGTMCLRLSEEERKDLAGVYTWVRLDSLARREALINCSISYHQSQGLRTRLGTHNLSEARERNRILLKDIGRTQMNLYQEFISPPSPRFTTLQKNYWAMVKSQLPLWEQDMGFRREETQVQQHTASQQQQQGSRKKKKKKNRHQ